MVIEIPRPSTKPATKAKDNSVKGKYTKGCLTVQQKKKKKELKWQCSISAFYQLY